MTNQQLQDERETFSRVWQRVSSEPRADSPIVLCPDSDPEEFLYITPKTGKAMALAPVSHMPEAAYFGPPGADFAPILQNLILRELVDMRVFQALRRNTRGEAGRRLAELADRAAGAAKRLAAAYFFLSGQAYWPLDRLPQAEVEGLPALRECFLRAQKSRAQCLKVAESSADEGVQSLCRVLAAEKELHLRAIQGAVEDAITRQ